MLQDCPNHAIGRPTKTGEEEIVGQVTALELYAARDHDADLMNWRSKARAIVDAEADIPGIEATVLHGQSSHWVPQAAIVFTTRWSGPSLMVVVAQLRRGNPLIYVNDQIPNEVMVIPHVLEPGEVEVIARRLREVVRETV